MLQKQYVIFAEVGVDTAKALQNLAKIGNFGKSCQLKHFFTSKSEVTGGFALSYADLRPLTPTSRALITVVCAKADFGVLEKLALLSSNLALVRRGRGPDTLGG